MSEDIEKLKELLHPNAVVKKYKDGAACWMVILGETKALESHICVGGIPNNTIVFNLDDSFNAPDRIFGGTKQECCRSDYVFVSDDTNGKYVICAEVKSGDDTVSHIKNQLRGSTAFVEYCKAILQQFWRYNFLLEQYEFHYVAFAHTTEKGTITIPTSAQPPNTTVNAMLKLSGQNKYQFNHLVQKRT